MMMMKTATVTERSDLQRLVPSAIKAANSKTVSGVERCSDIVGYLKSLSLSSKDLRELSKEIHPLQILRNHEDPEIRLGVQALFNLWMSTLYSRGREASSSNSSKSILQKPVVVVEASKTKEGRDENPRLQSLKTAKNIACRYAPTRIRLNLTLKKQPVSKLKKNEDEKSKVHETCEIKSKKPIQAKKQNTPPMKLSENPKIGIHGAGDVRKSVPATTKPVEMKLSANPRCSPGLKKNAKEMLELFEIAKKSADVANAKGLFLSKAETSICIDTLSLLLDFPISATSPETRQIMMKLQHLTKHRDRKICNSASMLLRHWRESNIKETK